MIRLGITDDHPLLADGIRNILTEVADIELIASYGNAQQTRNGMNTASIDVLLLDINLPDTDGIELCKELKNQYPELKIIGLTSHKHSTFLKNLMKSGAKGFLLKNAPSHEIVVAIRTVHEGNEYIQKEMKELLVAESYGKTPDHTFIPRLTRREKEILALIADEYTTQEMADKLFLSTKTIETHRQNLIAKLGVKNSVGLVKAALEKGLI